MAIVLALAPAIASAQFAPVVELSALDGSNGFVINGSTEFSGAGAPVSAAGDINGDGIADLIIGATGAVNPVSGQISGAAYVLFGSNGNNAAVKTLSALDGSDGFMINSIGDNDRTGYAVSAAGDVNGDDLDDILLTASLADSNGNNNAGAGYVIFGSIDPFAAELQLSSLDGSNGFAFNGAAADDWTGNSASAAGDFNNDGFDDVIIGARLASPNGMTAGVSYVVFGASSGFASNMNLADLDGTDGFALTGAFAFERSGVGVSAAGDINDDGIDDLIVTANTGGAGAGYVIFGTETAMPAVMSLSTLDGNNGFVFNGVSANDRTGYGVSGIGDINGDGIDDLIIGAFGADPNGDYSGACYVVFGRTTAFPAAMSPANLDGSNGFVINGVTADNNTGRSVSGAGDLNGDGISDLIVGANRADPNGGQSGASYVLFGRASGDNFPPILELSTLDGSNGFVLNGVAGGDEAGISVSDAGDVNGDGVDDVVIGAWRADPEGVSSAGSSYVVFGKGELFADGFE